MSEEDYVAALVGAGVPEPFAKVLGNSDEGARNGWLFNDSKTLSKLIGRPTTPITDSIKAAL